MFLLWMQRGPILSKRYVVCNNCGAYGPNGDNKDEAIEYWNSEPRKEDVEMKKSCSNCIHISKEVDGKVYCTEEVDADYSCKYWETVNPFESSPRLCWSCKYNYVDDECAMYCGREIGNPKGCVCDKWSWNGNEKESISTPLNAENSSGLKPFIPEAKDELKYIQRKESTHNQIQQLAEEAAELAQAALKFNRVMGCGCYTPVNPKDARDAVIEELADVLLCLEAAFPHCLGNMNFYSNLARIYREKAERWAERLKEAKDE